MITSKSISKVVSKTDHRYIGLKQNLFFFDGHSQGSCFFQPRGAHIYNKLIEYLRGEYKTRGYKEVITPNIYNCQLWQTSGHWNHYHENMIKFNLGDKDYSLKPMNCPGHCLIYKHNGTPTSDELPIRLTDFGVLHRNEQSGAILGLTRVRRFQQDDAHIFCTHDQVDREVEGCLKFAEVVYKKFGFTFDVELSLRPDEFMGANDIWDNAEESLRLALKRSNVPFTERKKEGAFYGPKIDLIVKDTRDKSYQCATIQLDFQLPERFDLTFTDTTSKVKSRPVIIHRAILGSLERFIAMITENYKGRWPFWLSPLQAQVIPVHESQNNYAQQISQEFQSLGYWVDCDIGKDRFNAKIREATMMPYNLILVVGDKEQSEGDVTCRIVSNVEDEQTKDRLNNRRIKLQELKDLFALMNEPSFR